MQYASQNFVGRMFVVLFFAAGAGMIGAIAPADCHATPISVPNFSFETPVQPDGGFTNEPISGWTVTGSYLNAGAYNSTNTEFTGSTGGALPAPGNANNFFLLNQTRSGTAGNQAAAITSAASLGIVQANAQYSLTVALGNRKTDNPDLFAIEFLVNDVVVPSSTVSLLGSSIAEDTFQDLTTSFTTAFSGDPLEGGTLKVRIRHSTLAGSGVATGDFDNVRVNLQADVIPFPEPSAGWLLGLGIVALRQSTRRRR